MRPDWTRVVRGQNLVEYGGKIHVGVLVIVAPGLASPIHDDLTDGNRRLSLSLSHLLKCLDQPSNFATLQPHSSITYAANCYDKLWHILIYQAYEMEPYCTINDGISSPPCESSLRIRKEAIAGIRRTPTHHELSVRSLAACGRLCPVSGSLR